MAEKSFYEKSRDFDLLNPSSEYQYIPNAMEEVKKIPITPSSFNLFIQMRNYQTDMDKSDFKKEIQAANKDLKAMFEWDSERNPQEGKEIFESDNISRIFCHVDGCNPYRKALGCAIARSICRQAEDAMMTYDHKNPYCFDLMKLGLFPSFKAWEAKRALSEGRVQDAVYFCEDLKEDKYATKEDLKFLPNQLQLNMACSSFKGEMLSQYEQLNDIQLNHALLDTYESFVLPMIVQEKEGKYIDSALLEKHKLEIDAMIEAARNRAESKGIKLPALKKRERLESKNFSLATLEKQLFQVGSSLALNTPQNESWRKDGLVCDGKMDLLQTNIKKADANGDFPWVEKTEKTGKYIDAVKRSNETATRPFDLEKTKSMISKLNIR